MSDEQSSFTVKDRRHFTPEGGSREDDAPTSAATVIGSPDPEVAGEPAGARHLGDQEPPDFTGLLVSLGSQAGSLLSAEAPTADDLVGARGLIGLLEVLQQKSEGNRTPDEDRVLEGLLYQLRMAYVAVTRRSAGA